MSLVLSVKKLYPDAKLPTRESGSNGYDLYAQEGSRVYKDRIIPISVGISLEIPRGHVGLLCDRSSLGVKCIKTFAGVIDENYRGEIKVCQLYFGMGVYWEYKKGDRIAQILILPSPYFDVMEVENMSTTNRGAAGFGSTGK